MSFLPAQFNDFLSLKENRSDFIMKYLSDRGLKSSKIVIDGKSHVLVQYDSSFYNSSFRIKTVVAHHDRVENTPGANDNSAACWLLMNWACYLAKYPSFHNVRIFFTDGEELGWNTGVNEQGAFGIASTFKRLGITNDDVYVFDACGRGEIPILARNNPSSKASDSFLRKFNDLYVRTQSLLSVSSPGRWMSLPVPYSDNASFLACGIPAVAITMLPAEEASLYARMINQDKNLENQVMNRESSRKERKEGNVPDYSYKDHLPLTWRLFHTPKDSIDSLTSVSFRVMESILKNLADSKIPL